MKDKNTLVALIVLLLLGSYWYFVEVKKKKTDEDKKAESERLFPGLKDSDVSRVEFKSKDGVISAIKDNGSWKIEKPGLLDADDTAVNALVADIVHARIERKLESAAGADYNLGDSSIYCAVSAAGKDYRLLLGGDNPAATLTYVQKAGDRDVYLTDSKLKKDLDKGLFDFRFKGLFRAKEPDAYRIVVGFKDKKYTLEKVSGAWKITAPFADDAKKESAALILGYMNGSGVKSFAPAAKAAASRETITVYSPGNTDTAYFGRIDAKKNSVYAWTSGSRDIFELPDYIYKNIPSADAVINKQLVRMDEENIDSAVISYSGKVISAKRGKEKEWILADKKGIKEDKKYPVNPGAILSSLRWTEYKNKYPAGQGIDAGKYFTDPGSGLKIELRGKDKKTAGTLVFSNRTENGLIYVKVPERDTVFSIPESTVFDWHLPGLELK